jgi:glutaredoxin
MNQSIVLYSTGCPACKTLKMLLNNAGVPYIENNSIEDMNALGFKSAPVLRVGEVNMPYDDAKKWIKSYKKGEFDEKQ